MRFSQGVLYAGLASAILFAVSAPVKAGGIPVTSDAGTGFVDATGTASGATFVSESGATITEINLTPVTGVTLGIAEVVTGFTAETGFDIITAGHGTKVISDGTNTVQLEINITSGVASLGILHINGVITGMTTIAGNGMPDGYDFGNLIVGTTAISDTQTGVDFTTLLGNAGTTSNHGVLGIDELVSTVPEPSTLALLGIGMTGFFAFRRFVKRHATA